MGSIEDYAWSPDLKRLAFTSAPYDSGWHFVIGWIGVASGVVRVLATDSDPYVEWYELEWAPDGRRFVSTRHREYEHDDNVYASDLWLFDLRASPCRLTHTPGQEEDYPGWIDDARIRFESSGLPNVEARGGPRYVIELGDGRRPH